MKHFTDEQLEISADQARARELNCLRDILLHLKEIDRRRLYSKRKFPSIYEYSMERFKYSYDEVHRRVSAMKLLKEMPEIESKIADGSLQLTHLTQAQGFFKKAEHSKTEKLKILARLENTSKAETKKILYNEDIKARYSFEADKNFEEKVERLKGLHPRLSFDALMEKICDIALNAVDPTLKAERIQSKEIVRREKAQKREPAASGESRAGATQEENAPSHAATGATKMAGTTPVKREVWLNAQGKCQNCSSTFALEYDHIVPFAKGGTNTIENLRLLCRSCNQRHAIDHYKLEKMTTHLRSPESQYRFSRQRDY